MPKMQVEAHNKARSMGLFKQNIEETEPVCAIFPLWVFVWPYCDGFEHAQNTHFLVYMLHSSEKIFVAHNPHHSRSLR